MAKTAFAAMVPEVESTLLSTKSSAPICSGVLDPGVYTRTAAAVEASEALRKAVRSRSASVEADADGLDLRDRHEAGGIVDADKIARCHANGSDTSGDWCLELGVPELQAVSLQHRLIRLDRLLGRLVGGTCLIQLLLRRDLLRDQLLLAP